MRDLDKDKDKKEEIKLSEYDGELYPSSKDELDNLLNDMFAFSKNTTNTTSKVIIAPNSRYEFTLRIATKAYSFLPKETKTVFILASAANHEIENFVVSDKNSFETPLGEIYVHQQFTKELVGLGGTYSEEDFINEYGIETQIPLIQKLFPDANIVPILMGNINSKTVKTIFDRYYNYDDVAFVISSNLSKYYSKTTTMRMSNTTADMIEFNVNNNFMPEQAEATKAINGLIEFARSKKFSFIRLGLDDSSSYNNYADSVIAFGAWAMIEKSKEDFIKENYADILKKVAALSIKSALDKTNVKIDNCPKALETKFATFVTLGIGNNLRGSIGSVLPKEPLIVDLCQNARNAAFKDPRFTPLEPKEFEQLGMMVSLVTVPQKLDFDKEEDLYPQINVGTDGVIIQGLGRTAFLLPDMWTAIETPQGFIAELKKKANLTQEELPTNMNVFKFQLVNI